MKRLTIALLISLVGIAFSWKFLRPREWSTDSVTIRQSIGKIINVRNDVSRQEEGRLLWSSVQAGDVIRVGDKIKTAGLSTAIIELDESSSRIEIEENSIVAMNQGEKKLSLNMLEGRVFVKQDQYSSGSLDLMSGGKKIDVTGNTAISVGQDGSSQVESFTGSQNLFSDLRPDYSENILSSKGEVDLSWKAIQNDTAVEVRTGESPVLLKKAEKVSTLNAGKLTLPMKAGLNYWQLVTVVDGKEVKSPLMKLTLIKPLAPTPLAPSQNEVVRTGESAFDFKWIKGNTGENVRVEVARDENFQNIVLAESVKDQTFFTPTSVLGNGTYFWRVKSQLPDGTWLDSQKISFSVHQGSGLLSPTVVSPMEKASYFLRKNAPKKIHFEWRKQNEVSGYELKVKGPGFDRTIQSSDNFSELALNKTGKYVWEVTSFDLNGKKSFTPTPRSFEIKNMDSINWVMSSKKIMYLTNLPIVILRWQRKSPGVSKLRISSRADLEDAEVFQVRESDFPYRPLKAGSYFAQVTATDDEDEVEAESPVFDFEVVEAPLPPAPLLKGSPVKIITNSQGDLKMEITNTKPEWLAIAQIRNPEGKVIDERRFSENSILFNGLLPGKYLMLIKFNDEYKRTSEVSTFQVEVPEKSKVPAPKIKGIKVR